MLGTKNKETLFFKSESKYYRVKLDAIIWVYAQGNHCTIYTNTSPSEFTLRISTAKIMEHLGMESFCQTHRNYLVNLNHIEVYDPTGKIITNNQEIPVSKTFKKSLEEKLSLLP